jgi:hypothetical protein
MEPKIRDDIDLKELEKFGYRLGQDDGCHEAYIKDLEYNDYIAIYEDGRIFIDVEDFCGSDWEQFQNELLQDLIKADLVVKE